MDPYLRIVHIGQQDRFPPPLYPLCSAPKAPEKTETEEDIKNNDTASDIIDNFLFMMLIPFVPPYILLNITRESSLRWCGTVAFNKRPENI